MAIQYDANDFRNAADYVVTYDVFEERDREIAVLLRQAADMMERERKYEYIVEYETMYGWRKFGNCTYDSVEDAKSFIGLGMVPLKVPTRIMKRAVGEWEEVENV